MLIACVSRRYLEQVEDWCIVSTTRVILRKPTERMVMKIGWVYAVATVIARVAKRRPDSQRFKSVRVDYEKECKLRLQRFCACRGRCNPDSDEVALCVSSFNC